MREVGYASAADIDTAMRLGCGYPVGPLATAAAIGLPRYCRSAGAVCRQPGTRPGARGAADPLVAAAVPNQLNRAYHRRS